MLIFHQQFSYILLLLCTTTGVAVGIITSYPGRRCHGGVPAAVSVPVTIPIPVSVPITVTFSVPVPVSVTSAVCTSCLDYTVHALTIVISATGHAASVVTAAGRTAVTAAGVIVVASTGRITVVTASAAGTSVIAGIAAGITAATVTE